ncbi:MAG: DUF4351 domain-containing protein [Planctomycetes bacterium]|nr:DUF4351 domain-containing protein [Planctomycetota bacterium]
MKKKFVSTLTQTRDEGRAEGRSVGLAEGKAEGTREGRATLLLRQIARRFGTDAAGTAEPRLRTRSLAELDRLAERILDATTLDELFSA